MHRQKAELPAVRRHGDVGAPALKGIARSRRSQVGVAPIYNPSADARIPSPDVRAAPRACPGRRGFAPSVAAGKFRCASPMPGTRGAPPPRSPPPGTRRHPHPILRSVGRARRNRRCSARRSPPPRCRPDAPGSRRQCASSPATPVGDPSNRTSSVRHENPATRIVISFAVREAGFLHRPFVRRAFLAAQPARRPSRSPVMRQPPTQAAHRGQAKYRRADGDRHGPEQSREYQRRHGKRAENDPGPPGAAPIAQAPKPATAPAPTAPRRGSPRAERLPPSVPPLPTCQGRAARPSRAGNAPPPARRPRPAATEAPTARTRAERSIHALPWRSDAPGGPVNQPRLKPGRRRRRRRAGRERSR